MNRRFYLLSLVLFLNACAGIKGQTVSMEDLDQTAVRVHQSGLSDLEKQEFDEAKTRADNGEYDVTNKTVGQIIGDQAAYDADERAQAEKQARLQAEARARHQAQVDSLRQALTVALVDKGFQPADYSNFEYEEYITIQLALKNNSTRSIRAVKGTLNFQTPLGDSIYQSNFEDNDTIAAGTTSLWHGEMRYNKFDEGLDNLRGAKLQNIKLDWQPKEILFTDGGRLVVTE